MPAAILTWTRISPYAEASDQGHRVSAVKTRDGWKFSAWSPPAQPDLTDWQWLAQANTGPHYRQGVAIPQRRQLLGIYPCAEQAREKCEMDAAKRTKGNLPAVAARSIQTASANNPWTSSFAHR